MDYPNRVALTILACIVAVALLTTLFSFAGISSDQMFPYTAFLVGLVLFSAVLPSEYDF
jgi:hypothetical protein